jgi:SNF2 family DNA or RNA helicase
MILQPHNYQKDAIKFLLENRFGGIFADPGLGKTVIVLSYVQVLKHIYPKATFLVVAPLRVIYSVWPQENEKWNFNLDICNLHSDEYRKADIYLINPESLKKVIRRRYFGLIIDESTKFKNPKAKRFKLLKRYIPYFKSRVILTGTPIPKSYIDLFSQIFIIDDGKALGRFSTHYTHDYFYQVPYKKFKLLPFENSEKMIRKKISPLIMRIDANSYLDLPDLVTTDIQVDLPKDIQAVYKEVEDDLFTQIEEENVVLVSAASGYNACRQIANGGLYEQIDPDFPIPSNRKVFDLHDAKTNAIEDLVDELHGKPVLIAYHYKHDLQRLKRAFPDASVISGNVSVKRATRIIDNWNAGKIDILIGHPAAMGHGLNLQDGGNVVIWYSLTDNLENYIQFNRRIYRQGIRGTVFIYRIVANNTVDKALITLLESKDKKQNALLDALKEYRDG